MFRNLRNKTAITLLIAFVGCILFTSTVLFLVIRQTISTHYVNLAEQYTDQQHKNCQLHIRLIEETANLALNNTVITESLGVSTQDLTVKSVLDGMVSTNANIAGLTLYNTKYNTVHTSSNITSPPSYESIIKDHLPKSFLESSGSAFWFVRVKDISKQYSFYYSDIAGFYTLAIKIHSKDNELLGLLLIDTKLKTIFDLYKNSINNSLSMNNTYMKDANGNLYSALYNTASKEDLLPFIQKNTSSTSIDILSPNQQQLIFKKTLPSSDASIFINIPLKDLNKNMNYLMSIYILLSTIFIIFFVLLLKILIKSIIQPLGELYSKTKDSI